MLNSSVATREYPAGVQDLPAITVSGFLGSGARKIAIGVALELGVGYVDRQILVDAARQLGVTIEAVERRGERAKSIGQRIASVLTSLMDGLAAADVSYLLSSGGLEFVLGRSYDEAVALSPALPGQLDNRRYLATLTSVIRDVAERGNVVILGHGSEAILQHEPRALRVFVNAPQDHRVAALMASDAITECDAQQRIRANQRHRCAFNRHFFNTAFDDPACYDLIVRADRMSFELAVQLISVAARTRAPRSD